MNKIIKIILGIFVLLFIIGLLGSGGDNTSDNSPSNQVQEPATTSEAGAKLTETENEEDNISDNSTSSPDQEPATTSEAEAESTETENEEDNISDDSTSNQDQESATTSETEAEQAPETYQIGDRVVVGDRAYTVTDVKTASSVGDGFTKTEASGIYVIVTMTIENIGTESATMSTSDVKIIDSEGRTFESDSSAWTALENNILLKQIQPGLPVIGETIFDVPEGITCDLQVSGGFWGTDKQLISLGTIQ